MSGGNDTYTMCIAKGRSNILAEIDSFNDALENMIESIELHFCERTNYVENQIFEIGKENVLAEERHALCKPYFDLLEEYQTQLFQARNKLVICIYSICESSLASICKHYDLRLQFSPQNYSKREYYLSDYLYSIGIPYAVRDKMNAAFIVFEAIRPLRNYLVHAKPDKIEASRLISKLNDVGIADIEHDNENICIKTKQVLHQMLSTCYEMLRMSDLSASNVYKQKQKQ